MKCIALRSLLGQNIITKIYQFYNAYNSKKSLEQFKAKGSLAKIKLENYHIRSLFAKTNLES